MHNRQKFGQEFRGEEVDVDALAEEVVRLRGLKGRTVSGWGRSKLIQAKTGEAQPRRAAKPSWGRRLEPLLQVAFYDEEDERFRCGQ